LLDSLLVGDLDLVVCVEPTGLVDGLVISPCLEELLYAYAPSDVHVGAPTEWGPWVTYPEGSHTRKVIAAGLSVLGAPFAVIAESNQPEVLREMVRLGMGWAVLPAAGAEAGAEPLTRARSRPVGVRRLVVARRADVVTDVAVDNLASVLLRG
jgi:DNA-binding transcriptional LysR family regulator